MRQRTYGGVGSPAREGGLTRLLKNKLWIAKIGLAHNIG